MDVAALASTLKSQEIALEVGTRLTAMAKDVMEDQGASLVRLMESTKVMELSVNPHLGSNLDVRG
ncbi:MAG: putative motility protein [Firmicutes bacterium]|nr:putative motility protein [Bacillota bacterium]